MTKAPKRKLPRKAKRKPAKATPIDELCAALRSMVTAAETSGGRDNPEVASARGLLAKHGKTGT